jgi:hypothetical protein
MICDSRSYMFVFDEEDGSWEARCVAEFEKSNQSVIDEWGKMQALL